MSWRPSRVKMEASARALLVADLAEDGGRAFAFCPGCHTWRRVRLDRLPAAQRAITCGALGRRLRCEDRACRRPALWLRVIDRMHHTATLRVS